MAIPDTFRENFNTMLRAAKAGDLALVECTDAVTGEPRYVITAMSLSGDMVEMTPFGHLCAGNPFEEYIPPS